MQEINNQEIINQGSFNQEMIKQEETKQELLTEEKLKERYGKVYKIDIDLDLEDISESFAFYFKAPHTASVDRYIKNVNKNALKAGTVFVKENVIEEQKEKLEKVIEEYVGLSQSISSKLLGFLGFTDSIVAKKL